MFWSVSELSLKGACRILEVVAGTDLGMIMKEQAPGVFVFQNHHTQLDLDTFVGGSASGCRLHFSFAVGTVWDKGEMVRSGFLIDCVQPESRGRKHV